MDILGHISYLTLTDYKVIGCDVEKKAMGFFMTMKDGRKLVDEYYICPRCDDPEYFTWIERLVAEKEIDYAFVQPESEIVEWGEYFEKMANSRVLYSWDVGYCLSL